MRLKPPHIGANREKQGRVESGRELCPGVEEGAVAKGCLGWVGPGVPNACCGVTPGPAWTPGTCYDNCRSPWKRKAVRVTGMSAKACLVVMHKDCSLCSL